MAREQKQRPETARETARDTPAAPPRCTCSHELYCYALLVMVCGVLLIVMYKVVIPGMKNQT